MTATQAAASSKMTPAQKAALREKGLEVDGTPIAPRTGARPRKPLALQAVKTACEVFGIEAIAKLFEKHGEHLKKPLRQYASSFEDGTAERETLEKHYRELFPRVANGRGFTKREDKKVSKAGRTVLDCSAIATAGQRVKAEVVTMPDGRKGLFVAVVAVVASDAPVWTA